MNALVLLTRAFPLEFEPLDSVQSSKCSVSELLQKHVVSSFSPTWLSQPACILETREICS